MSTQSASPPASIADMARDLAAIDAFLDDPWQRPGWFELSERPDLTAALIDRSDLLAAAILMQPAKSRSDALAQLAVAARAAVILGENCPTNGRLARTIERALYSVAGLLRRELGAEVAPDIVEAYMPAADDPFAAEQVVLSFA